MNIVVLRVMTLTIVIQCIHNFALTNLLTIRMVKAKEDTKEAIVFILKAKPQVRSMTKAKAVAW